MENTFTFITRLALGYLLIVMGLDQPFLFPALDGQLDSGTVSAILLILLSGINILGGIAIIFKYRVKTSAVVLAITIGSAGLWYQAWVAGMLSLVLLMLATKSGAKNLSVQQNDNSQTSINKNRCCGCRG